MRRIIAALLLICLLSSCASGVTQAEYDKVVAERDAAASELEQLKATSDTSAPEKPEGEILYEKTIEYDQGNAAMIYIMEVDGIAQGTAFLTFDGKNPDAEYKRLAALSLVYESSGFTNYSIAIMSGTDVCMVTKENGELTPNSKLPASFNSVDIASISVTSNEELTKMIDFLSDYPGIETIKNKISTADSLMSSQSATQENVFIIEDEYVKIEYVGMEYDSTFKRDEMVFMVQNKTDAELTFQSSSMAIDGISLGHVSGSDKVAAQSSGKIRYSFGEAVPTSAPSTITGVVRVIDFSQTILSRSYDVSFVNVDIG